MCVCPFSVFICSYMYIYRVSVFVCVCSNAKYFSLKFCFGDRGISIVTPNKSRRDFS